MNCMNRFSIIGRLTEEPKLKELENGSKVVNIKLAVDRPYKTKDGKKITDFLHFDLWNKDAENLCNISKKGALINLEGSHRTKEIEINGYKESVPYLNVESYTHLANAKNNSNSYNNENVVNEEKGLA